MQVRALAAIAAILLMFLAGCAGGGNRVEDSGAAPGAQPAAPEQAQDGAGTTIERQIARSGEISVEVDDPAAAAQELREIAAAFDGFVTSEYVVLPTGDGAELSGSRSRVTMSVPADRFDEAMEQAATVGDVVSRSVSSDDVTTRVVDVEARIRTMRESIARLEELMNQAGSLTEITALEAELTKRQADLESLLAQQESLRNQVARSPIEITLLTSAQAKVEARGGFLAGLAAGWAAFVLFLRVLVTVAGAVLPFLVAAAVVAVPLVWWWRRRRAHRTRTPGAAAPGPAPAPASAPAPGPAPAPASDGDGTAADQEEDRPGQP